MSTSSRIADRVGPTRWSSSPTTARSSDPGPRPHDHVYQGRLAPPVLRHARRESRMAPTRPRSPRPSIRPSLPMGKVYLPDSSYREMTEWVLPTRPGWLIIKTPPNTRPTSRPSNGSSPLRPGRRLLAELQGEIRPRPTRCTPGCSSLSNRLERPHQRRSRPTPTISRSARQDLYRAQCNCPYWHGAFGGLYTCPHLRNAIYQTPDRRPRTRSTRPKGSRRPEGRPRRGRLQPGRPPGSPARK